jgi:SAM-dependent methyltransferase
MIRRQELGTRSGWTKEQVVEFLKREDLGYQRVELPYGLATPGRDRSQTANQIFGKELTGKTVLDVGSGLGYFCFEALKRGASKAVGLEVDPRRFRQASSLADCLGLPAEFYLCDIEELEECEKFDIVLCLNVLHHLKDPIKVLDKLIAIAHERLVLEVAGPESLNARRFLADIGVSWWQARLTRKLPVILVGRNGNSGLYKEQKFFFSRSSIRNLMIYHRNHFSSLEFKPSGIKGRYVVIADRRRVGRLIVIAGPGQQPRDHLVQAILKGQVGQLEKAREKTRLNAGRYVSDQEISRIRCSEADELVTAYDFTRSWGRDAKIWERDEFVDILECADELHFVTIWIDPRRFMERVAQEGLSGERSFSYSLRLAMPALKYLSNRAPKLVSWFRRFYQIMPRGLIRDFQAWRDSDLSMQRVRLLLQEPNRMFEIWKRWISFCEKFHPASNLVADLTEKDIIVREANEWLSIPLVREGKEFATERST